MPNKADTTHREARKIVRETKEWLATQSDVAPFAEFERQKSKLWDVYVSQSVNGKDWFQY